MEKKQKNKWLSFLADGMLSGLMIGIGLCRQHVL